MKKLSPSVLLFFLAFTTYGQQMRPYKLPELNKNGIPRLLDSVSTLKRWNQKKDEIRKVWLEYVGELPERPAVQHKIISETQMSDHIRQKIVINTLYNDTITAFLLIPNSAKTGKRKYPAILALHPTNAMGKVAVATPDGPPNRRYGYELVSRGYIVLAPDDLTSGERIYPGQKAFQTAPFYQKYPNWTIMAKTLVDNMQSLDFLSQHDRVDADRIGTIGVSLGGYNTFFLSSVDPRIKAVVSVCGLSSFTGDPKPERWGVRDWYTHFPALTPDIEKGEVPFEFNEIVSLSAPIPMFFFSTQNDRIFPHWQPIGETLKDVYSLYGWLGHAERFRSLIGPGQHDFPPEIRELSYDFLDQYLQQTSSNAQGD